MRGMAKTTSPRAGTTKKTSTSNSQPLLAQPVTPYGKPGTAGWSGSTASRQRAEDEAADGTLLSRQRAVLNILNEAGPAGQTWFEVGDFLDVHHGAVTGALSSLHKAGMVVRLKERRGRSSIYVLPQYVGGRTTVPHGRKPKPCANCGHTA